MEEQKLNDSIEESKDKDTKKEIKDSADDKKSSGKQEEKMVKIKESEYRRLLEAEEQYKDKYVRSYAELENVRKRIERDKLEFVKYANEGIITEFLDILDNLERSVEAAKVKHEDYSAFLKGIEMVMAHIYEMLKRHEVKPVESKGKKFDPNCHEVLMQEETNEVEDGVILDEFQKGYSFKDRIIRTAKVKVSIQKEQEEKEG